MLILHICYNGIMTTQTNKRTGRAPRARVPKTNLADIREQKGISQTCLSEATGIQQSALSRAEWTGSGIPIQKWLRISRAIDVDLREVFPAENSS